MDLEYKVEKFKATVAQDNECSFDLKQKERQKMREIAEKIINTKCHVLLQYQQKVFLI
jgi:hypothetical protein